MNPLPDPPAGRPHFRRVSVVALVTLIAGIAVTVAIFWGARGDELTATFVSEEGCLPPEPRAFGLGLGLSSVNDTFTLRGSSAIGELVAVSLTSRVVDNCYVEVTFRVPGGVQFFEVVDESQGKSWGPLDREHVASNDWKLTLS